MRTLRASEEINEPGAPHVICRAPALPCGSFEEKRLIVNKDEPRMDTNKHE